VAEKAPYPYRRRDKITVLLLLFKTLINTWEDTWFLKYVGK
jgi:hypothetical protein